MYAMGMGRYNVDTATARSINTDTAMRWNQYVYESKIESQRIYAEKLARTEKKEKGSYRAVQDRLRNAPTSVDIELGTPSTWLSTR